MEMGALDGNASETGPLQSRANATRGFLQAVIVPRSANPRLCSTRALQLHAPTESGTGLRACLLSQSGPGPRHGPGSGRQCRAVGSRCDAPPPADTYAALSQSSGKKSLLVFQILQTWQVNSRRQCHCRVSSWGETRGSNSLSGRRFPHQAQNSSRSVIEFRLSLTWLTARRVGEFRRDLVGNLLVQLAIGPEGFTLARPSADGTGAGSGRRPPPASACLCDFWWAPARRRLAGERYARQRHAFPARDGVNG
jgi:hypothetical protein